MNTTIFNRIAFSAMLVGFIGLTSCNKNDEPTPTPQEVQQHFAFVHYVDKSAYVGTFSDLTPQATDNKKAFEFGFGCYLFAKGNTVLVPEGKFGDKIHKFTRGVHGELIKAGTMHLNRWLNLEKSTSLMNSGHTSLCMDVEKLR